MIKKEDKQNQERKNINVKVSLTFERSSQRAQREEKKKQQGKGVWLV